MIFDGLQGVDRSRSSCARVFYSRNVDKKVVYGLHDDLALKLDSANHAGSSVATAATLVLWDLWKLAPIDGPQLPMPM